MHPIDTAETLIQESKDYLETKMEWARLTAVKKSSDAISNLVYVMVRTIITGLAIAFFSIAMSIVIGRQLNDYAFGFLIVGGFYLIVILIVFIQRKKWIKIPITNLIIHKLNT
jgi:hypothetical protein